MTEDRDLFIAYVRQSRGRPGETEDTSLSLTQQEESLKEWGKRQGFARIVVVRDHDETGRSMHRPGFLDLKAKAASSPGATIGVWKYDRFARNLIGQELAVEELEQLGVEVRSVTEPPGKLPRQLLGSIAEYYSDQLSERLVAVRETAAKSGRYLAALPAYGYRRRDAEEVASPKTGETRIRRTGPVEPDPATAPLVVELYTRAAKGEALFAICRDFTDRGIPGPRGGAWQGVHVRGILTNPVYRAVVRHKGTEVGRGNWEPLVPDDLWFAVVARLEAKHRPRPKANLSSWCEGHVKHACGYAMYLLPVHGHKRRDGTVTPPVPTFVCRSSAEVHRCGIPHLSVQARIVEAAARQCLAADLGDRYTAEEAIAAAERDAGGRKVVTARQRLDRARAKATARREKARKLYLDGDDTEETWEAEKALHLAEIARIDAELAALPATPDETLYRRVERELTGLASAIEGASDTELAALLAAVGEIVVSPEGITIAYRGETGRFVRRPFRVGF